MPPLTNRLGIIARPVLSGADCYAAIVGDSKSSDGASTYGLGYGIQRTWKPPRWTARGGRGISGPNAWGITTSHVSSETSVFTTRLPGASCSGGQTDVSPVQTMDIVWSANRFDGAQIAYHDINDNTNYAVGDPWSSLQTRSRLVVFKVSDGLAQVEARGRRNFSNINTATVDLTGANVVGYVDVDSGAGSGIPGVGLTTTTGYDETGKRLYIIGTYIYRGSAEGVRTAGFGIMECSVGGENTEACMGRLGLGVGPWVSTANALAWFQAMGSPNMWIVELGQNQTGAEGTELDAGTITTFKANLTTILNGLDAFAVSMHGQIKPILLISPYQTGYSATAHLARSAAMLQLSQARSNVAFIDGYQLLGNGSAATEYWTTDGVHPSQLGASQWAGMIWALLAREYQGGFAHRRGR